MSEPIICFGQQPCGFFPKRFLYAKIETARRLQKEIGGEIVFFFHDSDATRRDFAKGIIHEALSGGPVTVAGWRPVPTRPDVLPPESRASMPSIEQLTRGM